MAAKRVAVSGPQHRVGVAQAVVVEARGLVNEPARVADGVAEHAGAFGLAKGPVGVEGIVMDRLNSPSIYGPSSGK